MKKILLIAVIGLFAISELSAQHTQTQYFMKFPQANLTNPAFRPANRVTIGLPIISHIYFGLGNSLLNPSNFLMNESGNNNVLTALHPDFPKAKRDKIITRLSKNGHITNEFASQLLGVGFTVADDWYVDLSVSLKATSSVYIPSDMFKFIFEGNEPFAGSSIDLSKLSFEAMGYLETSIGLSKNISDFVRVGGKAKFLLGGVAANMKNNGLKIDVGEDYAHTVHSDVSINTNYPGTTTISDLEKTVDLDFDKFDVANILPSSPGFAIDLGIDYSLTDNFSVSASIVDLGFIRWKKNATNLIVKNDFKFDGLDISDVITEEKKIEDVINELEKSFKESIELTDGSESFTTGLPTRIYLAAQYKPYKYMGLGILSGTIINNGHWSQALSLSANFNVGNVLSTSLSYTMANRSYNNIGLGLATRLGPLQFYAIADQIPISLVKIVSGNTDIIMPAKLDYINFRIGFNLVFGFKDKTTEDFVIETINSTLSNKPTKVSKSKKGKKGSNSGKSRKKKLRMMKKKGALSC